MSEKVKLTMEQAEAIEKCASKEDLIKSKLVGLLEHGKDEPIAELTLETLVKALYIGYEVEETFEVGDWVKDGEGLIRRVTAVGEYGFLLEKSEGMGGGTWAGCRNYLFKDARHATPEEIAEEKQRRWWAKHGREVWELRENDLLYYDDEFKEVEEVSEIGAIMLSSERVYLPLEIIKSKYSVACFADDRKDIDGGDNE